MTADLTWTHGFDSGASLEAKLGLMGDFSDIAFARQGADSAGIPITDSRLDAPYRNRGVNSTGKYMRKLAARATSCVSRSRAPTRRRGCGSCCRIARPGKTTAPPKPITRAIRT